MANKLADPVAVEMRAREASRRWLLPYLVRTHPGYVMGAWVRKVCSALERFERAVVEGKRPRMMLFAPPQHGKSLIVSRAFPAWVLGRHPDWPMMLASYASTLASGHTRWVRNQLASQENSVLFPDCKLSDDSSAADDMNLTSGGRLVAVGTSGGGTGKSARVLIIDDPIADKEAARSVAQMEAIWSWYQTVGSARIWPGGGILLMNTRWDLNDLAGRILAHCEQSDGADKWEVLSFPAISENNEALHPERYSLEELEAKRANMPPEDWAALYQQSPVPDGGNIFKQAWWGYYDAEKLATQKVYRVVQSWDTAFKARASNDTSSCITVKCTAGEVYVVDFWCGRVEFPELKDKVKELARKWQPTEVLIEDKASGQSLIQELKRESLIPIVGIQPDRDKVTRAKASTVLVSTGRVLLPVGVGWVGKWLEYFTTFPAHKVKDPVDAFTQLMQYLKLERISDAVELRLSPLAGGPADPIVRAEGDPNVSADIGSFVLDYDEAFV